jgi:hypothetical protein
MMGPSDPLGWAKLPKSSQAIEAIFELARRDKRFRVIRDEHIANGVASKTGRPLQVWDGRQWVAP